MNDRYLFGTFDLIQLWICRGDDYAIDYERNAVLEKWAGSVVAAKQKCIVVVFSLIWYMW